MSPDTGETKIPELTDEQWETADYLLEVSGLTDKADTELEMMGLTGTVRYGLGRCGNYLMQMTPGEIQQLVLAKLEMQPQPDIQP